MGYFELLKVLLDLAMIFLLGWVINRISKKLPNPMVVEAAKAIGLGAWWLPYLFYAGFVLMSVGTIAELAGFLFIYAFKLPHQGAHLGLISDWLTRLGAFLGVLGFASMVIFRSRRSKRAFAILLAVIIGLMLWLRLWGDPRLLHFPMEMAAFTDDVTLMRMVLVLKPAVAYHADRWGITPLHLVAMNDDVEMAKLLVDGGADVIARERGGSTPLHYAAESVAMSKFLVSRGADVNARADDGTTPLFGAAEEGSMPTVAFLLSRGAGVNAGDKDGSTPLLVALENWHWDIAKLLLTHGALVGVKNSRGITPLHLAAKGGNLDLVKLLISKGADVNARGDNGSTPLSLARNHAEVISILRRHGAR